MRRVWIVGGSLLLASGCARSGLVARAPNPLSAAVSGVVDRSSSPALSAPPTISEPIVSPSMGPDSAPATAAGPCPSANQSSEAMGSGGVLGNAPTSVRLCGFAGAAPTKDRPSGGVVLGAGPAIALVTALRNAAVADAASAVCDALMPGVLMQFSFAGQPQVNVPLVSYGCSQDVAFVNGQPRVIDVDISDTIEAGAGSYLMSGAAVPDLYGKSITDAETTAAQAGASVDFGGQLIDPAVPAGTVVLQYPPAGAGQDGPASQIDLIIAVPAAPNCQSAQLAIDYYGGGPGGGGDFGSIRIRDITDQPCTLAGSVDLVGTDKAGHAVTTTLTYPIQQPVVLSADAPRVTAGQDAPLGEVAPYLTLGANYTDAGGLCVAREVIPASWRLSIGDGTLTVPNASNDPDFPQFSSLLTCGGALDDPIPIRAGG